MVILILNIAMGTHGPVSSLILFTDEVKRKATLLKSKFADGRRYQWEIYCCSVPMVNLLRW